MTSLPQPSDNLRSVNKIELRSVDYSSFTSNNLRSSLLLNDIFLIFSSHFNEDDKLFFAQDFHDLLSIFKGIDVHEFQREILDLMRGYLNSRNFAHREKTKFCIAEICFKQYITKSLESRCKCSPDLLRLLIPVFYPRIFGEKHFHDLINRSAWYEYTSMGEKEMQSYFKTPELFFKLEKQLEMYLFNTLPNCFFAPVKPQVYRQVHFGHDRVDLCVEFLEQKKFYIELKLGKREKNSGNRRNHENQRMKYEKLSRGICLLLYAEEIHYFFPEIIRCNKKGFLDISVLNELRKIF